MDNFAKFVILGALPNRKASTVAAWMMKEVIGNFGIPLVIKSDNGLEFKGLFEEIC